MDFLHELHIATLVDGGKGTTFVADVFNGSAPFAKRLAFTTWTAELQGQVATSMERAKFTLASMDILMDKEGLMGIFTFTPRLQHSDGKKGMNTILHAFPEEQCLTVECALRPLDELDKIRLDEMATVGALRPRVAKGKAEEEEEEEFDLPYELGHPAVSMAQFLDEMSDSEDEEEVLQPRLAFTDSAETFAGPLAMKSAFKNWVIAAQKRAAAVILSVGTCKLTYFVATGRQGAQSSCHLALDVTARSSVLCGRDLPWQIRARSLSQHSLVCF